MLIEPPKKSNKAVFFIFALLLTGAAAYLLFIGDLSNFASGPSSFTVQNFWGKTLSQGKTPERAKTLSINDRIQTGPDGGIDLKFKGTRIRVKENSELRIQAPKNGTDRIQLKKGLMLVSSNTPLQISVPRWFENAGFLSLLIVNSSRGIFSIGAEPEKNTAWVQILTGKLNASTGMGRPVVIKELEKAASRSSHAVLKKATLTQTEWKGMSEAYELVSKSTADEARQLDLSKKAGNFFESVFDHGTFYDPKSGFCERDFKEDAATKEVLLEARYDVFPRQALVGVYMKTRNFDISRFQTLKFDMKRVPEAGFPERFLFEVKYKGQVIRKYLAKMIREEWTTVEFPLTFNKVTPVDEVTLTFSHDQVGALKKGAILLKQFTLEPKLPSALPAAVPAQASIAEVPVPVAKTLEAVAPVVKSSAPVQDPASSDSEPVFVPVSPASANSSTN